MVHIAPMTTSKYEYRTMKGSRYGNRTRKSTNPNLRWVGTDSHGQLSIRSRPDGLNNVEHLVCCEPWTRLPDGRKVRIVTSRDEKWIERS